VPEAIGAPELAPLDTDVPTGGPLVGMIWPYSALPDPKPLSVGEAGAPTSPLQPASEANKNVPGSARRTGVVARSFKEIRGFDVRLDALPDFGNRTRLPPCMESPQKELSQTLPSWAAVRLHTTRRPCVRFSQGEFQRSRP
jgi:hypothetical protein